VSQKFYTLLVLKKAKAVELDQSESFGPIYVTKGPDFETCKL
jgi:chromatin segregation and condensation protein Rec8/ScpA/Scc1 (kleisin family)